MRGGGDGGESMKLAACLVGSFLIMGCSGSTAQVSAADTFVGSDDASSAGDVNVPDAAADTSPPSSGDGELADAGPPPSVDASDGAMIDAGSPPSSGDANIDAPVPVDATPPGDGGPTCTPTDDKVACEFGYFTVQEYSRGIADDGCGSYYNCSASHCGVRVPGTQDAGPGVGPDDPWPCATAGVTGWEYECDLGVQVQPAGCVMTGDHQIMCCPIPKDGQPFSKVIY